MMAHVHAAPWPTCGTALCRSVVSRQRYVDGSDARRVNDRARLSLFVVRVASHFASDFTNQYRLQYPDDDYSLQ